MTTNYFETCSTNEEIKATYKKLAKQLHPDCGGSDADFQELQRQFKEAFNRCGSTFTNKDGEQYTKTTGETPEEFMNIINQVIHLDGIKIEIIGSWVWLSGNTMQYKEIIKGAGFWWSKSKKAWYYTGEKEHHKRRGRYSLDQLRDRWTHQEIETEKQARIGNNNALPMFA